MTQARLWGALFLLLCLSGCGIQPATPTVMLITLTPPPTKLEAQSRQEIALATPTATQTPDPLQNRPDLIVWWGSEIFPASGSPAEDVLNGQLADFQFQDDGPSLLVRVKRREGVGGILSTLHTASQVAPGALPDVALIRREDMAAAVEAGLIFPLEGTFPAALREELFPPALLLGEVDGTLYGLAYLLETQHIAYRPSLYETPPLTFGAVLESDQPFAFALGSEEGVSAALLIQYFAAGGRLSDAAGVPLLDQGALRSVLEFYQQAAAAGLIWGNGSTYRGAGDYWTAFLDGDFNLAHVDSTTYLASERQRRSVIAAPLVTAEGQPLTPLDGWLWVMTTIDPERQERAWQFFEWMIQAERQADFARVMARVPALREAVSLWNDGAYGTLTRTLLEDGAPILPGEVDPTLARALQNALEAVLSGGQTADEAAATVAASLP